ncbi:UNVERIFIED_CONTAM: hypothetical protein RMT77_013444 [Armadillidium vulgare]
MSKQVCLLVLSSSPNGVSAPSFLQCYKLIQSAFILQIATPDGAEPHFIDQDEQSTRWLADMESKSLLKAQKFSDIKAEDIGLVIIPHSPGAIDDLTNNEELGQLLHQMNKNKKPLCTIGLGVCSLFSAKDSDDSWSFMDYSLTGSSLGELIISPIFVGMPYIPSDIIFDKGGRYCEGAPNTVHVIINRNVVTGQNPQSTLSAIQNTILLANQRKS